MNPHPEQDASEAGGLFRRASLYLAANVANALLPFLLLPFLVRELGAAEYGTVGLFASSLGMFSVVVGLGGVGYARVSYYKLGADEYREALGAVLTIFFASAALAALALAGALAAGLLAPDGSVAGLPASVLALGLLGGACQFAFSLRLALWQMAEQPGAYGAAMLAVTALNLALSIALVFGLGMGWEGRAWGIVVPLALLGLGSLAALLLGGGVRFGRAASYLPRVLAYSLPLVPHALIRTAIPFCERSALATNTGLAEAGLFFVAFQLALPVRILANSLNLALKPWSYQRMADDDRRTVVRGSYASMLALALAALAWAGVVWVGFVWVAGPELAGGRLTALWLIASGLFSGFYLVVVKALMFVGRTRTLMLVTVPLGVAYCGAVFALDDALRVAQLSALYHAAVFGAVWYVGNRLYPEPWFGGRAR